MNKDIRLLIESFFDDEIFNQSNDINDTLEDIGNDLINQKIQELISIEGNFTEYPKNFYDIDKAEKYTNFAFSLNEFLKKQVFIKNIGFNIEFLTYQNKSNYDVIHFFINDLSHPIICDVALENDIIYDFRMYIDKLYSVDIKRKDLYLYIFDLLCFLYQNKYKIKVLNLNPDISDKNKIKNIRIYNSYNSNKVITKDIIDNLPDILYQDNDIFNNKVWIYISNIIFENKETVQYFLDYLKNHNIKKIDFFNSTVKLVNNIENDDDENNDKFKYYDEFRTFLIQYAIQNNLEVLRFNDKFVIEHICHDFCTDYLQDEYDFDNANNQISSYIIENEKNKDKQGKYIIVIYTIDFDLNRQHYYCKFKVKIYNTGLLEFFESPKISIY